MSRSGTRARSPLFARRSAPQNDHHASNASRRTLPTIGRAPGATFALRMSGRERIRSQTPPIDEGRIRAHVLQRLTTLDALARLIKIYGAEGVVLAAKANSSAPEPQADPITSRCQTLSSPQFSSQLPSFSPVRRGVRAGHCLIADGENPSEQRRRQLGKRALPGSLCNGSSPVANLQQQSAATKAQPGGRGCDYSRLARRKRRLTRLAPPLCKQGVRGSSPLGSTL
jgi:hypothetical protein